MGQKIAIVMGSDSDLPVAKKAMDALESLAIPYTAHVLSAHRTPDAAAELARSAREKGYGAIIAFAGMAAHLAGVLAAYTTLPVIGVPCKGGVADGMDALLSMVQMPPGVPVAVVALNGGMNAALLAAQILAVGDEALAKKLAEQKEAMRQAVEEKNAALQEKLVKGESVL